MTEKQRIAVIALLRLTYYQDEIILHDKELQKDVLSVLEGIFENEIEKQGAKFHKGDWVVFTAGDLSTTLQIVNVDTNKKLYRFNDNSYLPIVDEECLQHWSIEDAKDGDVLAYESGWTCIFKTLVNDETFSSYCFMDDTKWFCEKGSESHTLNKEFGEIKPATKEQRDILFKAMADAGYEFDFEKKELMKIK